MSNAIDQGITAIALLCYAATCLQLLCYRRGVANYRMDMSCMAWLLIALTGSCALEILLGTAHSSFGQAGIAFTLCVLVYRAQGNVATIIRGNL